MLARLLNGGTGRKTPVAASTQENVSYCFPLNIYVPFAAAADPAAGNGST